MPSTQDVLTNRWPVRKTRSSTKINDCKISETVRSRKFVSRYGDRVTKSPLKENYGEKTPEQKFEKSPVAKCLVKNRKSDDRTKTPEVKLLLPELQNRSPLNLNEISSRLVQSDCTTLGDSAKRDENVPPFNNNYNGVTSLSSILSTKEVASRTASRKNLNIIFQSITDGESQNLQNVENVKPTTAFNSPQEKSPTKTYLNSPPLPKSPKRKILDQPRASLTSPPKRSKEINCNRPQRCFTPIALFKQNVSSYQTAKQALHSSTPTRLIGRDRQLKDLEQFLEEHLVRDRKPGCLYISGAPGTGKTVCLTQILQELQGNHSFTSIFINCMTVRNSSAIFEKIAESLGNTKTMSAKENVNYIEKMLCKQKGMIVLVLDEMDQLSTKNQHVLYSVFEWPRLPKSNLLLIGIANALDMTDRILPRLHACGCQPTLLHFPPYSQTQITAILQDRLQNSEKEGAVIKPAALQFCARKIAAQTGDVRKALDTCRRAVELVESKMKSQQVLWPTCDDGCNPGSPRRSPRKLGQAVELSQIMGVLHEIYGSSLVNCSSKQSDHQSSMPIQQKLLLCTLLLLTRHKFKGRDLNLGKFHEVYSKVCRIRKVEEVASVDFQSMCFLLAESNGLVQIKKNKENIRLSKIVLKANEDELQFVMKDKSLLVDVLADQSVLN